MMIYTFFAYKLKITTRSHLYTWLCIIFIEKKLLFCSSVYGICNLVILKIFWWDINRDILCYLRTYIAIIKKDNYITINIYHAILYKLIVRLWRIYIGCLIFRLQLGQVAQGSYFFNSLKQSLWKICLQGYNCITSDSINAYWQIEQ